MNPKTKRKQEKARSTYIRLLSQISASSDAEPPEKRDAILCGELIEGHYLSGGVIHDHDGCICGASVTGITAEGRLFLQRLESEQRERSLVGRLKKFGIFIGGVLLGVLASVFSEVLKAWLHLK